MSETDIDRQIGKRVKWLRAQLGLSLVSLAERAGVSRAMLSRIERGESSATAQLLNKLCHGLGITLQALFAPTEGEAGPVSRRSAQVVWRDPGSGYVRRGVSAPSKGAMVDVAEIVFPAGGRVAFDNQRRDGAEQHVWVLDGQLTVDLDGDAVTLEAGDCLFMRLDRPVAFSNLSDTAVRYAVIIGHGWKGEVGRMR